MAGIAVEKGTFDAQHYSDSQFADWPTDSRYENVDIQRFKPDSSIDDGSCVFTMKRQLSKNVYMVHECGLEVKVMLKDESGNPPDVDARVAPVNNVLHSLFSSVQVQLEDVHVNPSPDNYMYKAYIQNVLGYGVEAQSNHLQAHGWYKDTTTQFESTGTGNGGFVQRNKLFRLDGAEGGVYTDGAVTFTGRLITDLQMCTGGIPPGVQVTIDLRYTSDAFRLMSKKPTTNPIAKDEKYQLHIKSMTLLMPIGTLNSQVYAAHLRNLKMGKEIRMHYKRASVKLITVSKGDLDGGSDHLFLHALNPSRVVVGFIPSKVFRGDYHRNPFKFARQWGTGADLCFIEQCVLLLNGHALNSLTSPSTRSDCNSAFYRMCHYMGLLMTPRGNHISYEEFRTDNYLEVFDLSTSGFSGEDYSVPAVKLGGTALNVKFSASTPLDLTIVIYAEYPSLIQIDKNGAVKMTYLDA